MVTASTQAIATARLLNALAERHGTDLHLVPGNYPMVRIEGQLVPLGEEPVLTSEAVAAAADFLLSPDQQALLERDRHVRAVYDWEGKARFRVVAKYELNQLSLSLRYIPSQPPTLGTLGAPEALSRVVKLERGLVLVIGPTGSGRSAVAAALIAAVNASRQARVVTIEHPVEYLFIADKALVEQREVGRDVASAALGLQQVQEEDVDVVLIDPVVTEDDWAAVLTTVEAGKLVVAVTIGDSIAGTLERIHASFPPERQGWVRDVLAELLAAGVVLRLLPKVHGGQVNAFEIVTPTSAVQAAIRDGRFSQLPNIVQTSREEGMQSLELSLSQLVRAGVVTREAAIAHAPSRRAFEVYLR